MKNPKSNYFFSQNEKQTIFSLNINFNTYKDKVAKLKGKQGYQEETDFWLKVKN